MSADWIKVIFAGTRLPLDRAQTNNQCERPNTYGLIDVDEDQFSAVLAPTEISIARKAIHNATTPSVSSKDRPVISSTRRTR